MNKFVVAAVVIIVAILIGAALANLAQQWTNPSQGEVVALDIYRSIDGVEWDNMTLLDWGELYANETNVYDDLMVVNTGTVDVRVWMYHSNAPSGWVFTWTPNGTVIPVGFNVTAPYELWIPAGYAEGDYFWDTVTDFEEA
jgi:hypothetical protein